MNQKKSKKLIPNGTYCYELLGVEKTGDKLLPFKLKIRNCPYYVHIQDIEGYCSLEKEKIDDQIKICKINLD